MVRRTFAFTTVGLGGLKVTANRSRLSGVKAQARLRNRKISGLVTLRVMSSFTGPTLVTVRFFVADGTDSNDSKVKFKG